MANYKSGMPTHLWRGGVTVLSATTSVRRQQLCPWVYQSTPSVD